MRYREYRPPVELAPWVRLLWVFEGRSDAPVPETIVADGFPELIVHYRSPFAEADPAGRLLRQPAAVACGQLTRPLVLYSSPVIGMVGIRFHPSGMAPFLSDSMRSLTDARVPAGELFSGVDRLTDEIAELSTDAQRVAACCRFLIRTVDRGRENRIVLGAVDCIMRSRGQISVEALARLVGTSRRSLEMAFRDEVGTSPKLFCRIARFRHVFDAVSNGGSDRRWAQVALDSGFFDQAHLIRDFRQFAGAPPTAFLPDRTSFAGLVNLA